MAQMSKSALADQPSVIRRGWSRMRRTHPALVLAVLDLIGLAVAGYLTSTEVGGGSPVCGPIHGCVEVAQSQYSRPFFGIPVAVYGVGLSITLFTLAMAWWRTNDYRLLLAHYGLSLVGVAFEGWFQFAQIFLIHAVCIWCETYGLSLILRFVVALWVYLHTPNPNQVAGDEAG
jgi:uncharacterized membrane protein